MALTIEQKAHKYLTEGKITVIAHNAELAVIKAAGSDPRPYTVMFTATGWTCDCPAHKECAHVVAAKLISPHRVKEVPRLSQPDKELDSMLVKREPWEDSYGYDPVGPAF